MKVDTKHRFYIKREPVLKKVRDVVEGEEAVREGGSDYLPCPPGLLEPGSYDIQTKQGQISVSGVTRYAFYASFAEFPELAAETLNGLQGLIHEKPPVIKLPKKLEYLKTSATPDGGDLESLWEKITLEVLTAGRISIFNEIYENDQVYLCPYVSESMINWRVEKPSLQSPRVQPTLVVFKEIHEKPKSTNVYESEEVKVFRELYLEPANGEYRVRVYVQKQEDPEPILMSVSALNGELSDHVAPSFFGDTFDGIPVTVINALNVGFDYGPIPVLSVVRRVLSIYRKTADYNRALYLKGEPQPVITGVSNADMPTQIGGGAIWSFPDPNATAKYLDIDGQGIPMMREAILDQYNLMARETIRLVDDGKGVGPESGEAVRRKNASRQVTLKAVVLNCAQGLERALKLAAQTMGFSESEIDEIKFEPHTDFSEPTLPAEEVIKLTAARNLRAPLSRRSFHEILRRGRLTNSSYDDEMREIEEEQDDVLGGPPPPAAPRVDNRAGAQPGASGDGSK